MTRLFIFTTLLFVVLGHTFAQNPQIDTVSKWEKQFFNDKFGEPTEDFYYFSLFDGVFSNSATTRSKLDTKVIVTAEGEVQIFLYKYGNLQLKGSDFYSIEIKSEGDDKISKFSGFSVYLSDRLTLNKKASKKFIELLTKDVELKIYISGPIDSRIESTYVFSIPKNHSFNTKI